MRRHFYAAVSVTLWLIMVVGFSDNWLTDVGQPSNSDPKFLVHAFFAFSWFTILVVQNVLVQRRKIRTHQRLGQVGFLVYCGFLVSTLPLYLKELGPLSLMVFSQLVLATILIGLAYRQRRTDPDLHKFNVMFGSFLLVQPAWDRATAHLFGGQGLVWLCLFPAGYALFIWHQRKVRWQLVVGFLVWLAGLVNVARHLGL